MSDHPKIIALEKLISERRMIQAKELIKDIDKDLIRLDELEKEVEKLNKELKRVSPQTPLPKK